MTIAVAQQLGCGYFEVIKQDVDDVIVIINYIVEDKNNYEYEKPPKKSDGFWDF